MSLSIPCVFTMASVYSDDDDVMLYRRSPVSVAAAAIFMASQASEDKKTQKGNIYLLTYLRFSCPVSCNEKYCSFINDALNHYQVLSCNS